MTSEGTRLQANLVKGRTFRCAVKLLLFREGAHLQVRREAAPLGEEAHL